jgi:hypothetical protein
MPWHSSEDVLNHVRHGPVRHRPLPDRQANFNPDRHTPAEGAWLCRRAVAPGRSLRHKDPGGHLLPRDPANSYIIPGTRDPESPVWAQAGNLIDDAFDRFESMGSDTPTRYLRAEADDVGISWAEIKRSGARKGVRKYSFRGRWYWQRGDQ